MGRFTIVISALASKATKKDIHNFWFLITVGIFFVLVAIAYSIVYRGSVDFTTSSEAAAEAPSSTPSSTPSFAHPQPHPPPHPGRRPPPHRNAE